MRAAAVLGLTAMALGGAAKADEPLGQPAYVEGDSWVYDDVEKINGAVKQADLEIAIERVQDDKMLVAFKVAGSARPPTEALSPQDWRRPRSVNGVETVVNRPLAFPLAPGKTWRVQFTEDNPAPGRAREAVELNYKVVGWTDVKVPAGAFKALKIEANGSWTADISQRVVNNAVVARTAPNVAASATAQNVVAGRKITGQIHHEYFYVPSIKRWVKSAEETFDVNGRLTRSSAMELRDFHAGG